MTGAGSSGSMPDVAIIGGGIGGLTLALALARRGVRATVYERSDRLREAGAGITLWPNATRVLFDLGLEQRLAELCDQPDHQSIRHYATGEPIRVFERGEHTRRQYGAPLYQMHRRDLHDLLAEAVAGAAPGSLRLGRELVSLDAGRDRPRARFADGLEIEADLIVGCDGIRSRVRTELFGPEAPRFTRIVAWRGLAPMERAPEAIKADPVSIYIGPGCHVAHYTVRRGSLLNFLGFAVVDAWQDEGWTIPSTVEEMLARFEGFRPEVRAMMAATPEGALFKWGLFDRDVREQWSVGQATLLGDAAHPMLPFLGQGAGMVIEDAMILSRLVARGGDLRTSLTDYERLRRDRTGYAMLKGRAHAQFYNSDPDEANEADLAMEIDLNTYDAVGAPLRQEAS